MQNSSISSALGMEILQSCTWCRSDFLNVFKYPSQNYWRCIEDLCVFVSPIDMLFQFVIYQSLTIFFSGVQGVKQDVAAHQSALDAALEKGQSLQSPAITDTLQRLGQEFNSLNRKAAVRALMIDDLTHLPLDKMAAILQTVFSDVFSWMKSFFFFLKFHWSLILRV